MIYDKHAVAHPPTAAQHDENLGLGERWENEREFKEAVHLEALRQTVNMMRLLLRGYGHSSWSAASAGANVLALGLILGVPELSGHRAAEVARCAKISKQLLAKITSWMRDELGLKGNFQVRQEARQAMRDATKQSWARRKAQKGGENASAE